MRQQTVVWVAGSLVIALSGCTPPASSFPESTWKPSTSQESSERAGAAASPAAGGPSVGECEVAWFEFQYSGVAPDFPTTLSSDEATATFATCSESGMLPNQDRQVELTQQAFNTVAQILERRIRQESVARGVPPCEAVIPVLKPVMAGGVPLSPNGGDVEGYAEDSFLQILRYNWFGGPFRLKYGVGCGTAPYANLWFTSDPYPSDEVHPNRYPKNDVVEKDPWDRTPVEGRMSTCITWGPGLGNDGVGGEGLIFGFSVTDENLPDDVRSCYPRAVGEKGLDKFPFEVVPPLPLESAG